MSNIFFYLLASFGLAFAIKQSDGPFNIFNKLRNLLMSNKVVGVFFYNLLSCYFCLGCWTGAIVYFLYETNFKLNFLILFCFASGAVCYVLDTMLSYFYIKNER